MIILFGGTFDPIHNGHLAIAEQLEKTCLPKKIHFIPCKIPAHREKSVASAEQRIAMIQLAIALQDNWIADDCELQRQTVSYTLDTVSTFREKHPHTPLSWVIGMDAFMAFDTWHRWQEILTHTHLIIVPRACAEYAPSPDLNAFLTPRHTKKISDLNTHLSGKIWFSKDAPPDISATQIRNAITQGKSIHHFVHRDVAAYIQAQSLYK